jgi:hypothetical protein
VNVAGTHWVFTGIMNFTSLIQSRKQKGIGRMDTLWRFSQLLLGKFGSKEMIKSLEAPFHLLILGRRISQLQLNNNCIG